MGSRAFLFPFAKNHGVSNPSSIHKSLQAKTDLKTLAHFGRGGTTSVVGEGIVRTEKARNFVCIELPLIRPFSHLLPDGEKTNSGCSENFYTLKICLG